MLYLVEDIENAREEDVLHLLSVVVERYEEVFPDRSITVITLEKARNKNEQIDQIISNLQVLKNPIQRGHKQKAPTFRLEP